jgi:Domain of unknown function (DUF397)
MTRTMANVTHGLTTAVWRKSSRTGSGSGGGGDCVEVAITTKLVLGSNGRSDRPLF